MVFRGEQGFFPRSYEISPPIPIKREQGAEDGSIWDTNLALNRLLSLFPEDGIGKAIVREFASVVKVQTEGKWQLSGLPKTVYGESGDIKILVPQTSELNKNNRFRHSLEVSRLMVSGAKTMGLPWTEQILLGVAGLIHDYGHPVFSHVGENFIQEVEIFAKGRDLELYEGLKRNNLVGTHEERLLRIIEDKSNPLGRLIDTFDSRRKYQLQSILKEEGAFGTLLSIADTIAYLKLDSYDQGYEAPSFENLIFSFFELRNDRLSFRDLSDEEIMLGVTTNFRSDAVERLLSYREFMYRHHYRNPLAKLLQEMKKKALWEVLVAVHEEGRGSTLKLFFDLSDEDALKLMLRESLTKQLVPGLAFFGIPYTSYRVIKDGNEMEDVDDEVVVINPHDVKEKTIILYSGFRPQTFSVNSHQHVHDFAPFSLPEGDRIVFYPPDFFSSIKPVLEKICHDNPQYRLSSSDIESFIRRRFPGGISASVPVKDRLAPTKEESVILEKEDQLYRDIMDLFSDFSFSYQLSDMLHGQMAG